MYTELKAIQELLWKNDDRIDQETLFELQNMVALLILDVAHKENTLEDLLDSFPGLYEVTI